MTAPFAPGFQSTLTSFVTVPSHRIYAVLTRVNVPGGWVSLVFPETQFGGTLVKEYPERQL
jgi:hypothetical protein